MDFTFVCPTEIIAFGDRQPEFDAINTQVIGASVDSKFTHLAWINTPRENGGLGDMKIPLVADFDRKVANDYGVLIEEGGDAGCPLRALFIISPTGELRQITVNDLPVGRNVDEIIRLIKAFQFVEKHGEVCPANWNPGDATMNADPILSQKYFSAVHGGNTIPSVDDDASFANAIKGPGLVVVDYWASWCKNCKKVDPVIAKLAGELKNVSFVKVDTNASDLGATNGVDALPTLQFFKNGSKVGEFKGSDAAALEAAIKAHA